MRETNAMADTLFETQFPQAFRMETKTDSKGYWLFLELAVEGAEAADPIEKMLVQQIMAAHYRVGHLYMRATATKNVEHELAYEKAVARVIGGINQLVSSLATHRKSRRSHRRKRRDPAKETKDSGAQTGK